MKQIQQNRIDALKTKNERVKSIISMVLAEAKNIAINEKTEMADSHVKSAVNFWAKKLKEVISNPSTPEILLQESKFEMEYLEQYLDRQATPEENAALAQALVEKHGKANIGAIMKDIPSEPVYDKKLISQIIKGL
jgi:uncharacterized protein YqeY